MVLGREALWPPFIGISTLLAAIAFALFLLREIARIAVLKEVRLQFKDANVLAVSRHANFLGFDRPWDEQWRGPGVLLLSRGMLYFRLLRRNLDLSIPLGRIEEVGHDYTELSRKKLHRECLRLTYRGVDGEIRGAAWKVEQPRQWIHLVHEARGRISHGDGPETKHISEDEDSSGSTGAVGG